MESDQNKNCLLENTKKGWKLSVDNVEVAFSGLDKALYFKKHYEGLGYTVRYIDTYDRSYTRLRHYEKTLNIKAETI